MKKLLITANSAESSRWRSLFKSQIALREISVLEENLLQYRELSDESLILYTHEPTCAFPKMGEIWCFREAYASEMTESEMINALANIKVIRKLEGFDFRPTLSLILHVIILWWLFVNPWGYAEYLLLSLMCYRILYG
jgi:hypothetical protein